MTGVKDLKFGDRIRVTFDAVVTDVQHMCLTNPLVGIVLDHSPECKMYISKYNTFTISTEK